MFHSKLFRIVLFVTITGAACTGSHQDGTTGRSDTKVLLISFDGFRYDYLSRTETPHFDTIAENGVASQGLVPIFPTKTFPNHYSIATGLYPEHTGIVANTMYDPKWDRWFRIADREAVENPEWYQGEPIWNTAEKQGLKTGTMFWVGSEAPIQGMQPTYWKKFDGDMSYTARIDTVVKWFSYPGEKAIDFGTLYFELVDDAGHDYGLASDTLDMAIQKADSLMGYLKAELEKNDLWQRMNILIVSDHGMVELSADKMIVLDSLVGMEDIKRVIWDPATMIQPEKGKTEEVYNRLKASEEHYRVYLKEDIPKRYHLKNHRRIPDILMVADKGYTILSEAYKDRFLENLPSANHGYDNSLKEMEAFFIAHGPAFRRGDTVATFRSIHLYELMSHLLEIEPAPNDGSLDSVRVLLEQQGN